MSGISLCSVDTRGLIIIAVVVDTIEIMSMVPVVENNPKYFLLTKFIYNN
ncbi:hypothetical protein ACEPPU_29975 (plasmid) [Priestia aryabhattai]